MNYMEKQASLRWNVLRSVLALGVGFAVVPWLGSDVLAADTGKITRVDQPDQNLVQKNKADIYAESASGNVGLNRFQDFQVGKNDMANMYFKTKDNPKNLDTLVNTVQNRIDINGTVNAIRDNKIGGNLYFLSPKGMVVGAGGVINAGSLTAITTAQGTFMPFDIDSAKSAVDKIKKGTYSVSSSLDAPIVVNGTINTMTGIDLRAAAIYVGKNPDIDKVNDVPKAVLRTGVVFDNIVNTERQFENATVIPDKKLDVKISKDGKIVIADPNDPNNENLKGDGSIRIQAQADSCNTATKFLKITLDTAEAKVAVGEDANIDAIGNVDISAKATVSNPTNVQHFWDFVGFTKATTEVDGKISGADVNIRSNANSNLTYKNPGNPVDFINEFIKQTGFDISDKLTEEIWKEVQKGGVLSWEGDIVRNVINQLYMPFNFTDAQATTTIGKKASLSSHIRRKFWDEEAKEWKDVGGNLNVAANSASTNVMKIKIQPQLKKGEMDLSKYFTGGFIYEDSDSKAIVNMDGVLRAEKNVNVNANAENTTEATLGVKHPLFYKPEGGGNGGNNEYASGLATAAVGVISQETTSQVNIGETANIQAKENLTVNANSDNGISSEITILNKDDTALSTSISVTNSTGKAEVNQAGTLQGGNVKVNAAHTMSDFSTYTSNDYEGEWDGVDAIFDSKLLKSKVDNVGALSKLFGIQSQQAAGSNVQNPNNPGQKEPAWNQYCDIGASVSVANIDNTATVNLKPTSHITSAGDAAINADVIIEDTNIVASNILASQKKDVKYGASAAVAVENMYNTAEVNVESNGKTAIEAGGKLSIHAGTDQHYTRVDNMVDDLQKGWEDFLSNWKDWSTKKDWNKKFQRLQNAFVDFRKIKIKDTATSAKESKLIRIKAQAAYDLAKQITGTSKLTAALEAFLDASNYANMHVAAAARGEGDTEATAMAAGSVGIQNLHNTAHVNIKANTKLTAKDTADIRADVVESNVLLAGKAALTPEIATIKGASRGLGGSVGVQNAYANSKVQIDQGVTIEAGEINAATDNDVLNLGLNFGGSKTSTSGITGMVNYLGGESNAETLIDDDVSFTAKKKVEHVQQEKEKEDDPTTYEDKVTASGAVNITAHNNANVISLTGDFLGGENSSVGVSTGVISYDVHTLAKVENLEKQADGTAAETAQTKNKKGTLSANRVAVSAVTDGTINNLTVAGTSSGKSKNPNGAGGGVNVVAGSGRASQASGGVQNAQVNAGNQDDESDPMLKVNAAGSVSWNDVEDTTEAVLNNVEVTLTGPDIGKDVEDQKLIQDKSASVHVKGEDNSYIGAYSGSAALTKFGEDDTSKFTASLSGAVAVNELKKSTSASLGNTHISTDKVAADVLNYAHNNGAQVATGLSLGVETGKRADDVSVNLGASGSANYVDSTVQAAMTGNTIDGGLTVVNNFAYDQDVQVAGGVTVQYAKSSASVGAAVSINKVKNTIQAAMKNNTIGTSSSYAQEVHNIAASHLTQVGSAVSVGVSQGDKSYAVGNVAVNNNSIENTIDAVVDGDTTYAKKVSAESKDGKLSVDEAENPYIDTLNSVSTSVDKEGRYCDKDGNALVTAFAVDKNGQKEYRKYTLHDDGFYYDDQNNKLDFKWDENAKKPVYTDTEGHSVDVTDIQYLDAKGKPVDVLAGEKRALFDLDGSDAMAQANGQNGSDFSAAVKDGNKKADYTSSKITLKNQGNTIVGTALGLGVKAGDSGKANGAGAVATSISHVKNNFSTSVKNASITTGASEDKNAALNVIASSDTRMVGVAAGVAAEASGSQQVGLGLAGSGVKQTITNQTTATVEDSTLKTDRLFINGKTESSLVSVAGQVSVTTSQQGVAGGLTWAENKMNNTTGAYARGLTLSGIDGTGPSLDVLAENNANIWAVAAGSSVSLGYGTAEGAYASNHGTNNTEAVVEKSAKNKNTISNGKSISVKASDTSSEKAVAGSVSVATGQKAMATLGGAVSYNNIGNSAADKQHVMAKLTDADITTADAGTVNVLVENKANLLNLALGGAVRAGSGSIGVSGQGSVAATTLYSDTYAGMQNVTVSKDEKASKKANVTVKANSQSQVTNSADALAVSAGTEGQIAFGGAVSTIKSDADTRTELKQSQLTVADLTAQAVSANKTLNIGIGLSVGASGTSVGGSLAGNVASNKIENDTTVSVDGSTLTADDTVAVLADSQETMQNYGGAISVGASGGGGGVSLGTTIVTNTISGNTEAHVSNSNITALGKGDGISVSEETVDNTTHSVNSNKIAKKGLVVNAHAIHTLKDLSVTAGVGASATAGIAADATVVINTIGGKTSAAVANTKINADKAIAELANADVSVTAYDKADINSHLGNVAVGAASEMGIGAAGAGDRNTISRETMAQITGNQENANTLNAHDVAVKALGETKIYVSESGVAAGASTTGAAAVIGSVSDDHFTSQTKALISGMTGTVHDMDVTAHRLADVKTYNNSFALSGGVFSGSVGVGVTNIYDESATNAEVAYSNFDTDSDTDKGDVHVAAHNDTDLSTELSDHALAVSIGGAVGVSVANVNVESQVGAKVAHSKLGTKKSFDDVSVTANNDISNTYTNVVTSGGLLVGGAVGKGAANINTGTSATVSDSTIQAKNITVGADENREVKANMVGVGIGAANVGVNVTYTNVGTSLKDSYDYDRSGEGEKASYDTKELQNYVNEALSRMNQQAEKAKTYDSSIEKGSTTINKGDASQAGLTTAVSHSTLTADDKLDIHAKATTNTDVSIYQAGVGIANVAVAANRMDVEDKLHVSMTDAVLSGNQVQIQSITDGVLKSYTGQGGFSGAIYADTTGYVKHGGTNTISVDDSTITSVGHPLWLQAFNQAKIDNTSMNINLAGVDAGRMVLDSEDSSEVAVQLGEKSKNRNTLKASSIEVEVKNAPGVKSENKVDVTPISVVKAKGVITTARATGKAMLNVSDRNTFDTGKEGGKVKLTALTGGQGNDYYTTEAISHAVGVSGVDITVNKSRTYNGMEASTTLGAASFVHEEKETKDGKETTQTTYADVSVGASNATTSHGYIHSVDIGLGISSGSNFAQNYSNDKATTSIDTGDKTLQVKSLDAFASNSDTVETKADGTSAGIVSISPVLAKVENTVHSQTSMQVKGQILSQGDVHLSALQNGDYNLLANGLTVTAVGGGAAGAYNHITNDTSMNLDNARIASVGDLLVDAENTTTLNRQKGFEKMVMGTGWDAVGVDTSRIDNTILSNVHVNVTDSRLKAAGNANVISHSKEDAQVNGYVYNVSAVGGAEARVNNTITNDDRITLQDSQLKTVKTGKDITLSAADDIKLYTYAVGETATGIFTGANALMTNKLTRNNSIDMSQGTNTLYSMQDIHLYAGKHADGSVSLLDLDAVASDFIGGFIPVFPRPSVSNTISQNNQITIGKDSASRSVRHSDFYAASGREMANVSANRYVGVYGNSEKGAFVSTDKGDTIQGKTTNNFVQVDGSAVAGVANNIDIVIGKAGDVVVLDKKLRDTVVGGAKDKSDISISFKADESTGLTKDSLIFGTEDYTTTLFERYQEIENLMLEYAKDGESSAAYQGYKAEAERIENEMLTLGLAEKVDGKIVPKASLVVDYVEIPELTSSGGNITVDTDDLTGSGTLKAQGTPEITITNNTNLMTKIDGITVDDAGGKFVFNGNSLTGKTTADFNKQISAINKEKSASFGTVEAADGQSGKITINGNYNGNAINYKGDILDDKGKKVGEVSGSMKPMANILIQGNVYSKDGDVTIKSDSDSIVIQGKGVKDAVAISGARVTLDAAKGNITQGYTDGIVNIGADVKNQYDQAYKDAISKGKGTYQVDQIKTDIKDGSKASGSYIAGGNVYINASDINVNGVIQSGFSDYYADISDATTKEAIDRINKSYDGQRELSDAAVTTGDQYKIIDGGAFWDAKAGCYKYKLNVYYNPSTKKILVENVDASGGQIYLTGRISSTGNGQIICLDGVSDISVKNSTGYDLKVGQLTTHDVNGLVRIQDTAKKTLTEITNGKTVVKTIADDGTIGKTGTESTFDKTTGFDYNPKGGLKYTWTSGKESTEYTKYKNDFESGGWGRDWGSSESQKELAKWVEEHPDVTKETGSSQDAARKQGETIRDGDSKTGSTVTVSHQEFGGGTTVDGTRKWSSGLWGYYKHTEVTWTESKGTRDTYDASIKADNPIHVKFIGNAAEDGKISINSASNVELTGNIGNTKLYETKNSDGTVSRAEKGTVAITSNGSLVQNGGSLYGATIDLAAGKDIENIKITAGDTVHVSAVHDAAGKNAPEQNTIDLTINGAYQAKGNVVLGHIGSVIKDGNTYNALENSTGITGLVDIRTTGREGSISQEENGSIVSDRINLTSEHGSIYGQKQDDGTYTALKVYAGQQPIGLDTLDASINAVAKGNISLEQTAGDMRIGQIISQEGDVNLNVSQGSVVDALPYVSNDRGDADDLIDRWRSLGLIDGNSEMQDYKNKINKAHDADKETTTKLGDYKTWDENALLYAIQDSVVNQTSETLPKTSEKAPNVIGHNITITVSDSAGINSGKTKKINANTLLDKNADGSYKNLDDLKALSKADASMVTWKKDAQGNTIAVISETLPIGVQQTTKNGTAGTLTVTSKAAAGSQAQGNIFLEGREDQNAESPLPSVTKDLYLGNITTKAGNVTLRSLGSIYNQGMGTTPLITGKTLYLSAANGSLGTLENKLTTNLLGSDKNTDGLTAVASGGIYIDQQGENDLIVRSISSGKDIYLGSDTSILMGEVQGTDAVNYICAENDGKITLEARGGSIGEAETDTANNKNRKSNKGVRILNSGSENQSDVTLRAKDNIYVTGVASADGKTATKDGKAGTLDLTVGYLDKDGKAGGTLKNIGISVDGTLNLTGNIKSSETASIYTAKDLTVDKTISSQNTYVGTMGDMTLAGEALEGTDTLTLEAEKSINQTKGSAIAANTKAKAGKNINLASRTNKLQNVSIDAKNGSATIVNANDTAGDLNVTTVGKVANDLTITNLKNGKANAVRFDKNLQAGGTIAVTNEEADIEVANGTTMEAQHISLTAKNNNVKVTGGTITAKETVKAEAKNVGVAGGIISAKTVRAEAEKLAVSGGKINASVVEATKSLEMTGGTIQTGSGAGQVSADSIIMSNGTMSGNDLLIKSTKDINQTGGQISAAKVTLDAENTINQTAGSILAKDTVAKAGSDVKLASRTNKLQNVSIDAKNGNATVVNANDAGGDLNVTTDGKVANDLTITNLKNGQANAVRFDKNLQAGGDIIVTNEEADIEVANGTTMEAQHISLTAKNNNVKFNGGTITAKETVKAEAKNVGVAGGIISAKTVRAEAEKMAVSGGMINASDVEATKALEITGGTIQTGNGAGRISADSIIMSNGTMSGNDLLIKSNKDIDQKGGQISAAKVTLDAGNTINQTTGSILAKDTVAKAGSDVKLASRTNKLQNVHVDAQHGSATIVSANDAAGDLNVTTDGKVANDLTITNLKNGKANAVRFDKNLQAGGDITITNEEANIEVADGTSMEAANISLLAKNNDVKISGGTVKASAQLKAKANDIVMNGGALSAVDTIFDADTDIVHAGGSIQMARRATLNAKKNILLQQGYMTAEFVDMIAGGYMDEMYDNEQAAANSYNLTVNDTLQVQAGGKNAADGKDYGVDLGSKKNILSKVVMNADNGNIILGNGGNQDLQVSVQNGKQVNGNVEVHNFQGKTANDVIIDGSLQATGKIYIHNDEKDILVQGTADDVIKGNDIQLTAAGSITNMRSIQAAQDVSLMAHQDVYNNGDIDAKKNVLIMTEKGSVLNPGKLEAGDAVTIDAKENVVNLGDAITANGDIRMKAGNTLWNVANMESQSGDVNLEAGWSVLNTTAYDGHNGHGSIKAAGTISITADSDGEGHGVYNDADMTAGQTVKIHSQNTLENSGIIQANSTVDLDALGALTNSGDIKAAGDVNVLSWQELINSGNMNSSDGAVLLFAGSDAVNGIAHSTEEKGNITAKKSVEITSYKGNVTNYGNISSGADVMLSSAWLYMQPSEKGSDVIGNVTNFGSIQATKDVLLQTLNGNISNQNQITSADGTVKMKALRDTTYTGTEEAGNINNGLDAKTPDDNADITAAKGIRLTAYGDVDNTGDYSVRQGSIQVEAQHGAVFNWGKYTVDGTGDIAVTSRQSIINFGDYQTTAGNVSMTVGDDVLNLGAMKTDKGDVAITSDDGSIYNQMGADLISGDGNVTLHAKAADSALYYYNDAGELKKAPDGMNVYVYSKEENPEQAGGKYIILDGTKYDVMKNGSVFNAGDALALNGTIRFVSDYGDVTNYDDFDTLSDGSTKFNGKDIATGNVEISAANGSLYNSKDIEAGGNISLTAADGLQNLAYNLYAGKDITLHATGGDIINTSVLESVYGDVTLVADNGNVINGKEGTPSSGDIITLGGTVRLEANGKDENGKGHSVTNYGDIVAVGKTNGNKEGSGSIVLKSEYGDVNNFDDLSRMDDGSESYQYDSRKHISLKGLLPDGSYNVATNNIEMSAVNGKLYNDKHYLVALKDVTLIAKDGLGSYGDVILAGGNIGMTDTDGDLINRANLVSMDGDISLKADNGSVINVTKGKVAALNGNVTMNAGGTTESNHQIYLVDSKGNQQILAGTSDVGDRILISESYYKDAKGEKHFLSNTEPTAPTGQQVYTQVSYINDDNQHVLIKDELEGQLEAFRKGDVVNRGDIVSLNTGDKSLADAGNVILKSAYGNVSNYDDFKLVDGKKDDKGQGFYDFLGANGVAGESGAKFNKGTAYTENKRYILSDSGIEMRAPEGYLYNDLAIISHQDVLLESGRDLTVGTNFASVEADGNIAIRSIKGSVTNNNSVISNQGSIVLDGETGVVSRGSRDSLQAVNGSISAVSTIGEINIAELFAGEMAAAGTKSGNIKIGAIGGKDVVLYTEDGQAKIVIGDGGVTVRDHLFLQGNDFELPAIDHSENTGTLVVDVQGVGRDGSADSMKGDLHLNIDGDVRFTTMNVTNADVRVGGKLSIDKLHVAGKGIFTSMGYVTGVYGIAPDHDSSNALYFDWGNGSGSGYGLRLKAEEFRAVKEGVPEEVRTLTTMRNLRERLDKAGTSPETFNTDNDGWMNLYVDGPRRQRSNGLLLHIDTSYYSGNQRWSAEDLSAKLLDYRPVQSYESQYGDAFGLFNRYNLWELLDDTEKQ